MSNPTIIDGINYGPLAGLIGSWKGDKGVDKAPDPDGEERNLYYETLDFEACGDVTNANTQVLAVVRYHQVVRRKSNDQVFHNESGYWSWDGSSGVLMQSLTIPRGFALLAGGKFDAKADYSGPVVLDVEAVDGDPYWGIVQAPFLREKARTKAFRHTITVEGDSLVYSETTVLDIYGKTYDHIDMNRLKRA